MLCTTRTDIKDEVQHEMLQMPKSRGLLHEQSGPLTRLILIRHEWIFDNFTRFCVPTRHGVQLAMKGTDAR